MASYAAMYGGFTAGMGLADKYYKGHRRLFKNGRGRGSSTAKRAIVENGSTSILLATRTLYTDPLISVNDTATNEIDKRQRDMVYVPGSKICYEFINNLATTGSLDTLVVNFAIVKRRCGTTAPNATDFFRSSEATRSVDFGTALSSLEFNCLPINTDEYIVLMRKKFMLLTKNVNNGSKFQKYINRWVKLAKQYRFKGTDDTPVCGTPYVVYWVSKMEDSTGTGVEVDQVQLTRRIVTYFREPK